MPILPGLKSCLNTSAYAAKGQIAMLIFMRERHSIIQTKKLEKCYVHYAAHHDEVCCLAPMFNHLSSSDTFLCW
ncbi:Uncharacterised protein [Vibrio cholerae]|nr:Uncharacterised protein [Vibrio cholerae]